MTLYLNDAEAAGIRERIEKTRTEITKALNAEVSRRGYDIPELPFEPGADRRKYEIKFSIELKQLSPE